MKQIQEDFNVLHELIRKAHSLIYPMTIHKDFQWLMDKRNNGNFKEKYPKCVMPINMGRTIVYAPICNRMGAEDPNMIKLAHKFVCKLSGHEKMHSLSGELEITKIKLQRLMNKFSKDIPKPTPMASKKAGVTIALNKIKNYNNSIKGIV